MPKKFWLTMALMLISTGFYQAQNTKGGGVIIYKSLGAATGNMLDYEINVYTVNPIGGSWTTNSCWLKLESSCYPDQLYNMWSVTGFGSPVIPVNSLDYCTPSTNLSNYHGLVHYRDTITLPGACADFKFSTSLNTYLGQYASDNLIIAGSLQGYYYATLNNTLGPNSSPLVNPEQILQAFCINRPLQLYGFNEADGDSTYFFPATALATEWDGSLTSFSYASGYNAQNQIGLNQPFNLDSSNGVLHTVVTSPGQYTLCLQWEEYRPDSSNIMVLRSEGQYVATIVVANNCINSWYGVRHRNTANSELLSCGDDRLLLATTRKISWPSITKAATEFIVDSKLDSNLAAIGYNPLNDTLVEVVLNAPITAGDSICLRFASGTDNNIILSVCGQEIGNFTDTLHYHLPLLQAQLNMTYRSNRLRVTFDGSASVNADSLLWDFGDGSPLQIGDSLNHRYGAAGVYPVTVIAFKQCGLNDTLTFNIEVCELPRANFQLQVVNDSLLVTATDSTFSYFWDLGDGNYRQGQNFSYRYTADGTYKLSLYAYNNCGDTVVSDSSFRFCLDPQARWTANIKANANLGATVEFDGRASRNFSSFLWLFGDGQSDSSSLTPQHYYPFAVQAFTVSLILENDCGESDTNTYTLAEIGLDEHLSAGSFSLFPNPGQNEILLDFGPSGEKLLKLRVLNIKGQLFLEREFSAEEIQLGKISLRVSDLPAGVYLLELSKQQRLIARRRWVKL